MFVTAKMNSSQKSNLVMGYCCINVYLRNIGIFCSRTCRLDTINEKGIEYSYELAEKNLMDLAPIFRWNYNNNIYLYRMSSEMFPFATHPDFYETYDLKRFEVLLKRLGDLARKYEQTITFHPGQFNQLSSHRSSVVDKAIIDIDFHAKVLDMMGMNSDSVIVIHGGSKQDGKEIALRRLETSYNKLCKSARERLVLENCELVYSIEDLLPLCTKIQVPIVVDIHHHNINPGTRDLGEMILEVLCIWKTRGITPLFHLSESRSGITVSHNITERRAHSDFIETLPESLLNVVKTQKLHLDIEAKMKEQAVLRLLKKYDIVSINEKYVLQQ